jgi:AcrR family transcriptional regulator
MNIRFMPKLSPEQIEARRSAILEAAAMCFAENGFHRTTMQDICRRAGVSPGALYLYFRSKEALIEGLCERDRQELRQGAALVEQQPNLLEALHHLLIHHCLEQPTYRRRLVIELHAEAFRNPAVAAMMLQADREISEVFRGLLRRSIDQGRLAPRGEPQVAIDLLMTVAEGIFFKAATDPDFAVKPVVDGLMTLIAQNILVPMVP